MRAKFDAKLQALEAEIDKRLTAFSEAIGNIKIEKNRQGFVGAGVGSINLPPPAPGSNAIVYTEQLDPTDSWEPESIQATSRYRATWTVEAIDLVTDEYKSLVCEASWSNTLGPTDSVHSKSGLLDGMEVSVYRLTSQIILQIQNMGTNTIRVTVRRSD